MEAAGVVVALEAVEVVEDMVEAVMAMVEVLAESDELAVCTISSTAIYSSNKGTEADNVLQNMKKGTVSTGAVHASITTVMNLPRVESVARLLRLQIHSYEMLKRMSMPLGYRSRRMLIMSAFWHLFKMCWFSSYVSNL